MSASQMWRLLLIENDEDDYLLTASMLREFQGRPVSLQWASQYEEGVQKLCTQAYDAVLVDYDLGARSGIELIREFSGRLASTPLVLYTGRGGYSVDVEAMEAGATLYITKHEVTPLLLERSIRYAIERKQIETDLRASNSQLLNLNRILRAMSNVNLAVMHEVDEAAFLTEVCRIVVRDCSHPLVWIGYAEHDPEKSVRPVAYSGFDREYIEALNVTWGDEPRGGHPGGAAIRTGRPAMSRDLRTDPEFAPWREPAVQRGYGSAIALPLRHDDIAFGALVIDAWTPEGFSDSEMGLLGELADSVAVGLTSIRLRQAKGSSDAELRYVASFPQENPNPVVEVDLDGGLRYINPSSHRLFPDLRQQKAAHPWLSGWPQVMAQFYAGHTRVQTRDVAVDGRMYQQTLVYIPERALVRIYASDITARTRAEQALRQSEERFRLALVNMPMSVGSLDLDLCYTWIYNPLAGFTPEDVLGQPIAAIAGEEVRNAIHTRLRRLIATGEPTRWEVTFQSPNGEMTVNTYAEPLRDAAGAITGVSFVAIDITERKKAEQMLHESEQRFHTIYRSAPFGIALATMPDGMIFDVNDAWLRMFGFERKEQVVGRTPHDLGIAADWEGREGLFAELHRLGKIHHLVSSMYTRSGEPLTVSVNLDVIESGGSPYLLASLEDITERQRAAEALNAQNERLQRYADQLERSNQALEDFAFVASHDLQEPLNKIRGFGATLKTRYEAELPADAQEYVERMRNAAARMQTMLDGLLAYSRISTQANPFSAVDLRVLVSEVLSDLEWRISHTGGRVEVDSLPVIQADPLQMQQVFQNLIANALKFHRTGVPPLIRMYCQAAGPDQVEITVEDNGIGFQQQHTAHLFKPFHRLNPRSEYEGAGMGLAICRKIIERHRGSIRASSIPGEGSRFTVTLPLQANGHD